MEKRITLSELRKMVKQIINESDENDWIEVKKGGNTYNYGRDFVDRYREVWEEMDLKDKMHWLASAGYPFADPEKIESKRWDDLSDTLKGDLAHYSESDENDWIEVKKGGNTYNYGRDFVDRYREVWEEMDLKDKMHWLASAGYPFADPEKIESKRWDDLSDTLKGDLAHCKID